MEKEPTVIKQSCQRTSGCARPDGHYGFCDTRSLPDLNGPAGEKESAGPSCCAGIAEFHVRPVDLINHPPHYTGNASGVECITVAEHFNFCLGNALKYIWRADSKGNSIEDLKKARWYLDREIKRRENLK